MRQGGNDHLTRSLERLGRNTRAYGYSGLMGWRSIQAAGPNEVPNHFRPLNPYQAQQDDLTGNVWFAGNWRGTDVLRSDNTTQAWYTSAGGCMDIDSPAPEPTSLILLVLGGLGLLIRRRPI